MHRSDIDKNPKNRHSPELPDWEHSNLPMGIPMKGMMAEKDRDES